MDNGTKTIMMIRTVMEDIGLPDASHPTPLYNDNCRSVNWSRGASLSKRLLHMNIHEVGVRDSIHLQCTHVHHIPGAFNLADIFTKEHKSGVTFTHLANQLIFPRFNSVLLSLGGAGSGCKKILLLGGRPIAAPRMKGGRMKGGAIRNGYSPTPVGREETSARPLQSSEKINLRG
jgi:hypothetical protein